MIYMMLGGRNASLNTQEWVPIRVVGTTEAYSTQVTIRDGVTEIIYTGTNSSKCLWIY